MAIGRMPPDFFWRAISLPPKKMEATEDGHLPSMSKFINAVNEVIRVRPDSLLEVRSRRC